MRTSISFAIVSLAARHVAADEHPRLQWDPATAKDCVDWYDNTDSSRSCKEVRDLFSITPEQFHEWNPSVGLDCTPWHDWQSYCIVTLHRLETDPPPLPTTSTAKVAIIPTTTTSTLGPSPTAWEDRGCYVEDPTLPLLDQNMSGTDGDVSLTIGQCKDSCYLAAYFFAGVQEGNQCWCGTYVGSEWARNQSDCNIPCTGDKTTFCGGKGVLNIFEALENQGVSSMSITRSSAPTVAGTGIATSSTASSGARRNIAMFW
ncbi:predicted protein [Chaetomium globosum CBS 148.51]|uniref:WSC domain-containing protein n=1 Tax=Chaetomium globosum (strain ATCC 6205 / CBS 148.51 / DSM 1962 / NBRC 6347 / NRRL 1970) TaxID=306901 RepID=Q2H1K0_CHAGB|nr:uncharacterized protein CHGG_04346 [Chaetomium globosum CBS 148.51]EAQ87727.1 predicted protein [Chaetomium globosum CBS 148.51]